MDLPLIFFPVFVSPSVSLSLSSLAVEESAASLELSSSASLMPKFDFLADFLADFLTDFLIADFPLTEAGGVGGVPDSTVRLKGTGVPF